MKILHITNWYPHGDDQNGDFIERHYKCAKEISESELIHIEVKSGKFNFVNTLKTKKDERFLLLTIPINSYRVIELTTTLLLVYLLIVLKFQKKSYDLYLFHIAYPLLLSTKIIKKIISKPIAIQEHWSAYGKNFNLKKGSKGHNRIASIFHYDIPVMSVSKKLEKSIVDFASCNNFDKYIMPNVVNEEIFFPKEFQDREKVIFFMIGAWSASTKKLMLGVEAFYSTFKKYPNIELRIAGDGSQIEDVKIFMDKHPEIKNKIILLGQIEYEEVGDEMRTANALVHPTETETFSLVCVEALFCETAVIASDIDPITSFVTSSNGILVKNELPEWCNALETFLENKDKFIESNIGEEVRNKYSIEMVSENMKITFEKIIEKWNRANVK